MNAFMSTGFLVVIPAKAGIQLFTSWVPAFAGTTTEIS
jgi:hypothetical protein